ncbi:solute carrier family 13 protein [Cystoisospora suis]|uniref:Solute carrier family 13 protein n=1 Tax=Cystoisospora suis TaxID=483139 RepID=A0A2C6KYG0_9APIC|nr:solute carrier family 13 protein [Cystoisospora suis]
MTLMMPAQHKDAAEAGGEDISLNAGSSGKRRRAKGRRLPQCLRSTVEAFASMRRVWLTVLTLVIPLLLFVGLNPHDVKFRCLYIVAVVVLSWLSSANDAVIIALYPLVLCPLLGVAPVKTLAQAYFRSVSFLMIGTCLLGASFTRTGLDKSISSFILDKCGSDATVVSLALMVAAGLLSMWINNSSATVILSPIAGRVVSEWGRRNFHKRDGGHAGVQDPYHSDDSLSLGGASLAPPELPRQGASISRTSTSPESVIVSRCSSSESPSVQHVHHQEGQAVGDHVFCQTSPVQEHRSSNGGAGVPGRCLNRPYSEERNIAVQVPAEATTSAEDIQKEAGQYHHKMRLLRNMIYIGLAYAASLGGMATLNGSFVNPVLMQLLETTYHFESRSEANPLTFSSWIAFAFPLAFLGILCCWFLLGCLWLGPRTAAKSAVRLPLSLVRCCVSLTRSIAVKVTSMHKRISAPASSPLAPNAPTSSVEVLPPSRVRDSSVDLEDWGAAEVQDTVSPPRPADGDEDAPKPEPEGSQEQVYKFAQIEVLFCLLFLIVVWMTRGRLPGGGEGWGSWFVPGYIDDSVPVLLVGILLFFLPLDAPSFPNWRTGRKLTGSRRGRNSHRDSSAAAMNSTVNRAEPALQSGCTGVSGQEAARGRLQSFSSRAGRPLPAGRKRSYKPILVYSYASKHIEWGALLLLGGGFAMATAIQETGLDKWLGSSLEGLGHLSAPALVTCVVLMTSTLTELMSNTAAANVILPILTGVAGSIPYNPLLLLLPAAVGVQFAFMLPIATAPNAIVLKRGRLRPFDLFISGILMKALTLCITLLAMFSWGNVLFDVLGRPQWAA